MYDVLADHTKHILKASNLWCDLPKPDSKNKFQQQQVIISHTMIVRSLQSLLWELAFVGKQLRLGAHLGAWCGRGRISCLL